MKKVMLFALLLFSLTALASAELSVGYDFANPSQKVVIDIPETEINQSLVTVNNSIYWNGNLWSDTRWLNIDGSNANQNIDVSPYNITAGYFIGDGSQLTNIDFSGYYPHDQDLNTTDNVTFSYLDVTYNISAANATFEYLNVTQDLYVKNSTIYLGNVSISSIEYPNGDKVVTFGDSFVNATGYFGDGGFLDNITFANGTVIAVGFNGTYFQGGNFTGDNFTGTNAFFDNYNWLAESPFLDFNGSYLAFNESALEAFASALYDQDLNTTSAVEFANVTSDFFGTYDWTAEFPWLDFNGTYLTFNDSHYYLNITDEIADYISNYTFTNLTLENLNVTGSITLNGTTVTDISQFEVMEYTEVILVNVSGGTGSNQSLNNIAYEITQIIVNPATPSTNYRFEAVEYTTGDMIDRNRQQHVGEWNIYKTHTINDRVNVSITSASNDEIFQVQIKYQGQEIASL